MSDEPTTWESNRMKIRHLWAEARWSEGLRASWHHALATANQAHLSAALDAVKATHPWRQPELAWVMKAYAAICDAKRERHYGAVDYSRTLAADTAPNAARSQCPASTIAGYDEAQIQKAADALHRERWCSELIAEEFPHWRPMTLALVESRLRKLFGNNQKKETP